MDEPVIARSASRHGVAVNDILHAFNNPVRVESLDEGMTMLIGASRTGHLLEIGIVESTVGPVVVHAMPARTKYLRD